VFREDLDLQQLLGGSSFTVPSAIACHGYAVSIDSLVDTGANGQIFIDADLAVDLARTWNRKLYKLPFTCGTRTFDGKPGPELSHVILLHFHLDGRRYLNTPMILADLGQHQMIIGRKWLANQDVWLDVKNRELIWPNERSALDKALPPPRLIPRSVLRKQSPNPAHQEDAERRDRAIEGEIAGWKDPSSKMQPKPTKGRFTDPLVPRTQRMDYRDNLAKMKRALRPNSEAQPPQPVRKKVQFDPKAFPNVNVAFIGAEAYKRHARSPKSECFIISLSELDRTIEDKQRLRVTGADSEDEEDLIDERLPECHQAFRDVFSKTASDQLPPHREGVDYRIDLEPGTDAVRDIGHAPLYKMSLEELEAVKQYLEANLSKGFIVPSAAPFASPVLVARSAGKLRFCVDYRKLNKLAKKDRYPLPLIDELMDRLQGAKYFTKLDVRQGFHRIRMATESEDLTTFRTRYGSFKYRVLPFGLSNGPSVFQRFMNTTFFDYLDRFMTAYVDDILIYSKTLEEHKEHVNLVLQRLREAGLQASIRKCEFHVQRTKYLGYIITTDGIEVDPEKVAVIAQWTVPTTVQGVLSFLGFCNFYRRFIRAYSRVAKPLYRLTKHDTPFEWSSQCQEAFDKLKAMLTSAPVLCRYDPARETRVETDASDEVIAGVLSQKLDDNCWHPVAFYSSSMSATERNYDIHDKEMLAVVRALAEWRAELEGLRREEPFDIFTDHRALEYFMTTKKLNARQARWAEFLSRFRFIIRYRPGKQNTLADALSRPERKSKGNGPVQTLLKPENLDPRIRAELAPVDPTISILDEVTNLNRTAASLESLRADANKEDSPYTVENGLLLYDGRLVVPIEEDDTLRARLLKEIHDQPSMAHPGQRKLLHLVRSRFYWTGWRGDVARFVRNCVTCRRMKIPRDRTPGNLKPLPIPDRPWQHISMDFMDVPKSKRGNDSILVIVCRLSKKPISLPTTRSATSRDLARLFLEGFYRYYGAPATIVSDRGPQFVSQFWEEFTRILGIKLKLSTAHHAQTNGQTEVTNQYLAMRLRPYVNHYQDDWDEWLPMMDHAAAAVDSASTGASPFLIANGYEPRTSFDWEPLPARLPREERENRQAARERVEKLEEIWNFAQTSMRRAQEAMAMQANRHRRPENFEVGDKVFLALRDYEVGRPSRKLGEQNEGPFEIVEKVGNSYRLALPDSMKIHPIFSPDKLRLAANDPLPGQSIDPPDPVRVHGEDEWEVEEILASRIHRGKLQYRAKWRGTDEDQRKWFPARDFKGAPHKVRDFHARYPDKPGPPRRLQEWLQAWEAEDDFLPDIPEDDLPEDNSAA